LQFYSTIDKLNSQVLVLYLVYLENIGGTEVLK